MGIEKVRSVNEGSDKIGFTSLKDHKGRGAGN